MAKIVFLHDEKRNFRRGIRMIKCARLQLCKRFKELWDQAKDEQGHVKHSKWNDDRQSGERLFNQYRGNTTHNRMYDDKIKGGQRDKWDMTTINRIYVEYTFIESVDPQSLCPLSVNIYKENVRKLKDVRNSYCHPGAGHMYGTRPNDKFQDDCDTFREVFKSLLLSEALLDEAMNIDTMSFDALWNQFLMQFGELIKQVQIDLISRSEGVEETLALMRKDYEELVSVIKKLGVFRPSKQVETDYTLVSVGGPRTLQNMPGNGYLQETLETAQNTSVQTDAYKHICEVLDHYSHVLISGSLGSGKTTMSLIIMGRYLKEEYQVEFVDDVSKFNPEKYVDVLVPTLIVFDDIFGHISLTTKELVHCRRVFKFLNTHLNRLLAKKGDKQTDIPFKVVMNCRTNVLQMTLPKLLEYKNSILRAGATANLTTLKPLNEPEKGEILTKHLERANIYLKPEDVTKIEQQDYSTLGFPYLCELFADNFCAVPDAVEFFVNPLMYLTNQIKKIFLTDEMKDRAAILLLMLLNDGLLNLVHLQSSEQRKESGLEIKLLKCEEIVNNFPSPDKICRAARNENHTFLKSEGDIMRFSHPAIHDAVALVVADENQLFVLENCSLQFILERTEVEEEGITGSPSGSNFTDFMIHLKYESAKYLIKRLAKEIGECRFALPLSHKCFSQEATTELLFNELSSLDYLKTCLHSPDDTYGLGFLFWSSFLCTGPLCRKSFEHTSFSQEQIGEGWFGCCLSGNEAPLQALKDHTKSNISNMTLGNILKLAVDTRPVYRKLNALQSPEQLDLPPEKETPRVHGDNSDMLIHIAAANGFKKIVEALLEMSADVNARGGNKMTALMYVCYLGHIDLVEYLFTKKADPSLLDEEGDNCLHLACRSGDIEIVKVLYEKKMDLNTRGEHDRTPLMYASYNGHEDVVRFLLDKGAIPDLDSSSVENKDNCLHLTCIKGHKNIVRILLSKGAMDIEGQGGLGRTALMYACRHGQLDTAKELVNKGAKTDVVDKFGFTCLHLTAMKGHIPTAKWLFGLQKDQSVDCQNENRTTKTYINHTTKLGWTPMMLACKNGNIVLLKHLVKKGGDVSKGFPGHCLHSAAFGGHFEIVEYLVSSFPELDINKTGLKNRTPFMCACFKGFTRIAKYLNNKGAHVDCKDEYGQTSLHYACFIGCLDLVTFLLSLQSLDIDCSDNQGETPLSFAIKSDNADVIELLVKKGAGLKKRNPQK